ncbi:MAG: response regulator [Bacteroidales bacterium]|nr:response regulator [Bacteroidales bacterium]
MNARKFTILIVDDSKLATYVLEDILKKIENVMIVGRAVDGLEAVELYKKLKPDIVTMDLVMPGMNGEEAVRQILEFDKEAKIIVVSSVGSSQDKFIEELKAGVLHVIPKPYEVETVTNIILNIIEKIK